MFPERPDEAVRSSRPSTNRSAKGGATIPRREPARVWLGALRNGPQRQRPRPAGRRASGATLFDLGGLQVELGELLGIEVDLLTPGGLSLKFREQVLAESQPV